MCRLRYYTLGHKLGWRLAGVTAFLFFLLGAISFGYGIKLLEYAEKKDITPIFAAVPMLLSGFLGAGVVLSRKKCAVTSYAIMSVIVLMLSIHMNYRFMVKEYSLLPLYRTQCQTESESNNQQFCHQYAGTVMLCCVSVSMIPVAIGAFLACLVAHKTLKKKNIYLPWFTFSKVEPAENNRKTRVTRNNNKIITFVNYKQSSGRVGEIPETRPSDEYIPDIPDFMELAIPNSTNPAYRASVMVENEEAYEYGASIKNFYSKSLNDLEESNTREMSCVKDGEKSYSNDLLINKDALDKKRRKKRVDKHALTSSDLDLQLKFADQDFFNRKKLQKKAQYYDSAAEDWIQKIVDSAQNSRSRLYGVSDEEDLESDSELAADSKPFLSKQNREAEVRQTVELDNDNLSSSVHLLSQNKVRQDCLTMEDTINEKDIKLEFLGDTEKEIKSLSQEENKNLGFSRRKRINASSSPGDLEQSIDDNKPELDQINIHFNGGRMFDCTTTTNSDVVENFSKDMTPPGLITPMAGRSSPGGQLHFEFDKLPSAHSDRHEIDELPRATTEHAHWMEFEGEDDRKKLIKGKMSESEYTDLTSYVM